MHLLPHTLDTTSMSKNVYDVHLSFFYWEILHILLQSEVYILREKIHATEMNILHIICMHFSLKEYKPTTEITELLFKVIFIILCSGIYNPPLLFSLSICDVVHKQLLGEAMTAHVRQ